MKNRYKTKEIDIDGVKRIVTLCANTGSKFSIFTNDPSVYSCIDNISFFRKAFHGSIKSVNIGYAILNPIMDKDNTEIAKDIALGRAIKNPICSIMPNIFLKHDKQFVTNIQIDNAFEQCFLHLQRHFKLYVKVKDLNKVKDGK